MYLEHLDISQLHYFAQQKVFLRGSSVGFTREITHRKHKFLALTDEIFLTARTVHMCDSINKVRGGIR